jgi:hypothetical protein
MLSPRRPTTSSSPLWRRRAVRAASLLLGCALALAVVLPWFSLPLLGWSVPIPAWNALGLALLVLGALHGGRALGLPGVAWAIRALLPWTIYRWWQAEALFRDWGKGTLAPLQLKLSGVNSALETIGAERVTVFDPVLWRDVLPGPGYKLAGLALLLGGLVTLLDWPSRTRCGTCRAVVDPEDSCCHACGGRFPEATACSQCGRSPRTGDRFCRACGGALKSPETG